LLFLVSIESITTGSGCVISRTDAYHIQMVMPPAVQLLETMRVSEGEIFLLDFGLAKGAAGQMATVRTGGSVHGYTPLYAPLEQIHGQGTDPRTDIYSLGATLYDLLTGQPPVAAPARFEASENERPDPLPPANRLNSRVSSVVAEVIQRAMAVSRRNRFSSAAEMRDGVVGDGAPLTAPKRVLVRTQRGRVESFELRVQEGVWHG